MLDADEFQSITIARDVLPAGELVRILREKYLLLKVKYGDTHDIYTRIISDQDFQPTHIEPVNPLTIVFHGVADDGAYGIVVQHCSQFHVRLVLKKRPDPDAPRAKFGFGPPSDTEIEAKQEPATPTFFREKRLELLLASRD